MQKYFVDRLGWITEHEFEEIYTLCKLMPGPIAPQFAISIGRRTFGAVGGILAGLAFITPAILIVILIAALYTQRHVTARQELFFHGMQIGAVALIIQSLVMLFKVHAKKSRSWVLAGLNFILTRFHPALEPIYILGSGAFGVIRARRAKSKVAVLRDLSVPLSAAFCGTTLSGSTFFNPVLGNLFWACFKAAAFIFGTGIAVVPLLEYDFVLKLKWLSHAEFMDALAVGQITPGPFVITATFIGYKVAGLIGAAVASSGIFLPSFLNILVFVPLFLGRLTSSPYAPDFVSFALPAVVGCIGAATWKMILLACSSPRDAAVLAIVTGLQFVRWLPAWGTLLIGALLSTLMGIGFGAG